jgi:energy-coupling factor transport system ATP-binding protein
MRAVDSITLNIAQGEFIAVLGRNGSGKSTLGKLMNALFMPSDGKMWVAGICTDGSEAAWDVRAHCGMVFQNPDNQIIATIVEEDVAFGLENLGVAPDEMRRRVDEALSAVGMAGHGLSAPHMLSGGQKQRVAIAGVLAMRPSAIVFDEATAMLDPIGRAEVMRVVKRLCREEQIAVVWITHFMDEAAQADRVIVLDEGKARMEGPPGELFERAEEVRAAGLDVPEMTELAGLLREDGIDLPRGILTVEGMAEALCRLKSAT